MLTYRRRAMKKILQFFFLFFLVQPFVAFADSNPSMLRIICHLAMPWVVGNQVVETLLYIDNENHFIPCLADSYQMYDKYIDIQLRKNIRFQDGTPFDASSVLMNWDAYRRTAKPYFTIDLRMGIKHMEALSPHSVRMWFKEDGLIGLMPVYLRAFYIYSPSYFQRSKGVYPPGNQANLLEPGPWGTGPYMVKEALDNGDTIILERNPTYWQEKFPKTSTIIIYGPRKYDSVTAHQLMKEGKADLFDSVDPSMLPIMTQSKSISLIVKRPMSFLGAPFNMRKPKTPLKDIRVRKALNLLINRSVLFKYLARGSASVTPFIFPLSDKSKDLQPYPYRIDEAKNLLNAAGYSKEHLLSITIGYFVAQKKLAHAIARMLEEGGVRIRFQEYQTRLDWYRHFMAYTHGPENPMENEKWDINIVFTPLYTNSVATHFGECFVSNGGYRWIPEDPKVDKMFFKAMRHRNLKDSEAALLELEKYLYHQYYLMPIYMNPTILAVHNRIVGNSFSDSGYLLNLKEIKIDKDGK